MTILNKDEMPFVEIKEKWRENGYLISLENDANDPYYLYMIS